MHIGSVYAVHERSPKCTSANRCQRRLMTFHDQMGVSFGPDEEDNRAVWD